MVPDIIIAAFIAFVIGMVVGCIIQYYIGEPKCHHEFEKIIDDTLYEGNIEQKRIVVHMCKTCGKRKITKV